MQEVYLQSPIVLMEGALGERLKREYGLVTKGPADMAGLVRQPKAREALRALWLEYAQVARRYGFPFLATTPTRRADRNRLAAAGLDSQIIAENVRWLSETRDASDAVMFAGGMLGCVGNAYTGEGCVSAAESLAYHRWEAERYASAGADFLFAGLMPTLPEAVGIAQAMAETGLPYVVSLTLQGDGLLMDGTPLSDAIDAIDAAASPRPLCLMTNCVHPRIVSRALEQPFNQTQTVRNRFLGLQANTSDLSFRELDNAADLHTSEPADWAEDMAQLRKNHGLKIFGGCCGTDARHLEAMASLLAQSQAARG